jgi:hypothetical protein
MLKQYTIPFVVGLILGVLGTIFLPNYVRPYIPEAIIGKATVVEGTVTAKQKKVDTLLLTVNTPQGALLATFDRQVDEINLLVNEKDKIEFTLAKYMPFIEDPKIIRVVKEQMTSPGAPAAAAPAEPVEKSTKEMKPREQAKPLTPAPVSKNVATVKPGGGKSASPAKEKKTAQ